MGSSKPFHPEDMAYDSDGEFSLADTLENHIGNRVPAVPSNPPPGPKWQARIGAVVLGSLNGAEVAVMTCLIDCASKAHGYCVPSAKYIAGWTSRPLRTVERAIGLLKTKKLVRTVPRGDTSSAFIISWSPLFLSYRKLVSFQGERKRLWSTENSETATPKVAEHDRQK